jgi:CBS domain-containing protein
MKKKVRAKSGRPTACAEADRTVVPDKTKVRSRRKTMQIRDVMTKEVASCNPSTNAAVAAEIMWNQNCGSLPIVEDGGRPVGIVTDRDLFIKLGTSNRRASEVSVGEIMRTDLSVCTLEDSVLTALEIMAQRKLHRLPVVDGSGMLQGIVSMDDIVVRAATDGSSVSNAEVVRALKAICASAQRAVTAEPAGL